MSVVYGNAFGGVISENRGGTVSTYVPDPLGSTIGLVDSAGTLTDSWTYWPYGEVRTRTGSNATPFTFLGVLGYFQDVLNTLFYVRARHLRVDLARWLTVDPLWPSEPGYVYVGGAPTIEADPSGMSQASCCFIAAVTAAGIVGLGTLAATNWPCLVCLAGAAVSCLAPGIGTIICISILGTLCSSTCGAAIISSITAGILGFLATFVGCFQTLGCIEPDPPPPPDNSLVACLKLCRGVAKGSAHRNCIINCRNSKPISSILTSSES